jgi:hypothetical protein
MTVRISYFVQFVRLSSVSTISRGTGSCISLSNSHVKSLRLSHAIRPIPLRLTVATEKNSYTSDLDRMPPISVTLTWVTTSVDLTCLGVTAG